MRNRDAIPVPARVVARLEALGVHMDRVWELLGLEAGQPPPMVTTETFFAFWRAVEEVTDRRDIGLVIGAESGRHGYSIATATALYAATLGEALETVARYKRIACPEDVDVEIARGEVSIRFHWILATTEAPRLLVDSAFASFASLARTGTDGKAAPARVELARRRADAALLRTHFECPIAFGATVDRLIFHRSALATPFVTADVEAFSRVVPGLEAELVGRSRTRSLRDDVRVAIARNMSRGRPSVEVVARRLHLSPRTLQRRLGDERTTYQQQLDQVRRTSARRLLANTELDTVDIAFLLGFEEPNSFARAFRSWERTTPVRWRERASRA